MGVSCTEAVVDVCKVPLSDQRHCSKGWPGSNVRCTADQGRKIRILVNSPGRVLGISRSNVSKFKGVFFAVYSSFDSHLLYPPRAIRRDDGRTRSAACKKAAQSGGCGCRSPDFIFLFRKIRTLLIIDGYSILANLTTDEAICSKLQSISARARQIGPPDWMFVRCRSARVGGRLVAPGHRGVRSKPL